MQQSRPSLALAMIMKNEAFNLPRLFKSIEGCFDEVHVVDTGSTDGSPEIAEKLGGKVSHFAWIDDFSAARNFAFAQAKTDFVMWLDLDDVLDNREAFIQWRDVAMAHADLWMAAYHYGSDGQGKPNCTFMRERVVRRNKNFTWKYAVHEGMVPTPETGSLRPDYIATWAVVHKRTQDDIIKDRSRNLKIFEKRLSNLDPREKFYYGKELMENGSPMEAFRWLIDAVGLESLEHHDRVLGVQYACMASMQCNQFPKAIALAYQGLQLAPNRAEFYMAIGDSYMRMNQPQNAMPSYQAAKNCRLHSPQGSNFAPALFSTADCYTVFPSNMAARLYGHFGDLDRAKEEAERCLAAYGHPETKEIFEGLKQGIAVRSIKEAASCSDIVITCPPVGAYVWDGDLYREKAMGGSETAAIEMAEWMHKLSGRPVKIFNMRESKKTTHGVEYIPVGETQAYMHSFKPWLHIAWRHNQKLTDAPTFVWGHDLMTSGAEAQDQYLRLLCLTPFHKKYAMAKQGIKEEKIHLTRNGIDPKKFPQSVHEKDQFKFVFSSSPDRGLDRAMRVLDQVREKYPQIKLHVAYGIEHLPKWGHQALHDLLVQMMAERKDWVIYEGALPQSKLHDLFRSSAYCVQPSDWLETSMISAMERLACGVYQIIRDIAGGADTLRPFADQGMAKLVPSECISPEEYKVYVDATLQAIEEEAFKRILVDPEPLSWELVAKSWLDELPKIAYPEHVTTIDLSEIEVKSEVTA